MNNYLSGLLNYYFGIACSVPFSLLGCFGCYALIFKIYYPWCVSLRGAYQRSDFISGIDNLEHPHTIVHGKPGTGKTLTMSILASNLSGAKYTSFPTTDDRIQTLVGGNLDLDDPHHRILPPDSNIFFDELGTFGQWSDPKNAEKKFPGVSKYLKFARHFSHRCFFANQRLGGGVGIELRALTGLFIETLGLTNYSTFFGTRFSILKLKTADNEEMLNSQTGHILVNPADFHVYKSRGMEPLIRIKNEGLARTDPKLVPAFLTNDQKL